MWLLFRYTLLQVGFPANHVDLVWNRPACQTEWLCVVVATNPTHAPATREILQTILISIARRPSFPPCAREGCEGGIKYLVRDEVRSEKSLEQQAFGHRVDHADKDVGRHGYFIVVGDGARPRCAGGESRRRDVVHLRADPLV